MHDAFISYRRKPSSSLALAIQEKLKNEHRIDAYVDTTRTDGTRVTFPERLMTAIADASVFICILGEREGEHTLESTWVLKEIERAHALNKFCIPIFQESYRPLPNMPEAVEYLLNFDGVHVMDDRNILIDASVAQIAALIRPKARRSVSPILFGVVALIAVVIGIAVFALNQSNGTATPTPTTAVGFVPSETPPAIVQTTEEASPVPTADTPTHTVTSVPLTNTPTPTDTVTPPPTDMPTPTDTVTPLPTDTPMPTPNATEREATLASVMLALQTEQAVTQAANDVATADALTATATLWTATSTPDDRATAAARLTETQIALNATATATRWTRTPTLTPTPTFTPTLTAGQQAMAQARAGVRANAGWTPYGEPFDGVPMMLVPAGCFRMGSENGASNERPVHEVCITAPYWIDQTEVTRASYQACIDANWSGCTGTPASQYSTEPNQPINRVTWEQATAYCAWRDARLPTEAEWEFAARGPDSRVYPWGNTFDGTRVIYSDTPGNQTAAVGINVRTAGASWVGALDMAGNVWEWTRTLYRDYPYDASDGREDQNKRTDVRVVRGGSFGNSSFNLRAANRLGWGPSNGIVDIGFRCARSS